MSNCNNNCQKYCCRCNQSPCCCPGPKGARGPIGPVGPRGDTGPANGLNAYGGAFYSNVDTILHLPDHNDKPLPLNSAMTAALNVVNSPVDSLTVKVAGDYEIYYYFSATIDVTAFVNFSVTVNGSPLSSTFQVLLPEKNLITGTVIVSLNANDVISTNIFGFTFINIKLSPYVSTILTVKKLNT